jgi:hypothetical protein
MAPDLNGDLVYSAKAGLYGAYFVVTGMSLKKNYIRTSDKP